MVHVFYFLTKLMILVHFELSNSWLLLEVNHWHLQYMLHITDQVFLQNATFFYLFILLTFQHLRKVEFLTSDSYFFSLSHKTFGHRQCIKWWIKALWDSSFHVSIQTPAWWVECTSTLWAVLLLPLLPWSDKWKKYSCVVIFTQLSHYITCLNLSRE